jgi:hypothetical protein
MLEYRECTTTFRDHPYFFVADISGAMRNETVVSKNPTKLKG